MTLAVSVKVNDGIVLAADSATTIYHAQSNQQAVNVYNHADKVFQLHEQLPIGLVTWGNGNIGGVSLATLIKDFRYMITYHPKYKINGDSYSLADIAHSFHSFISERYHAFFKKEKPFTGFKIAGCAAGKCEEWQIDLGEKKEGPYLFRSHRATGSSWSGQPEAITRLLKGYSPGIFDIMKTIGLSEKTIDKLQTKAEEKLDTPLVSPAMPIKDAVELAEFYIETTKCFIRFSPGVTQTVGGQTEIVAITKHEGFRWAKRKNGLH